jgi:hypothetical protein
MTRLWRTTLAVPVLVLALAGPAAAAQRKPTRPELATIAAQVWQRLTAPLAALGAKGGGTMDPDGAKGWAGMAPNGKPLPPPAAPSTSSLDSDGGGTMDPNGGPK